ncbi:MAG: hypothetical protein KGL02_12060 [Acidobacteriota bacterium]|nr:hypothetical protein [Acidobacteriota bacterium]
MARENPAAKAHGERKGIRVGGWGQAAECTAMKLRNQAVRLAQVNRDVSLGIRGFIWMRTLIFTTFDFR